MDTPTTITDETWLTISDIARLTGRTTETVRQWAKTGVLHADCRTVGGTSLFRFGNIKGVLAARGITVDTETAR